MPWATTSTPLGSSPAQNQVCNGMPSTAEWTTGSSSRWRAGAGYGRWFMVNGLAQRSADRGDRAKGYGRRIRRAPAPRAPASPHPSGPDRPPAMPEPAEGQPGDQEEEEPDREPGDDRDG